MAQLRVAPWLWVAMAFVFVVVVVVDAAPTTVNKKINQGTFRFRWFLPYLFLISAQLFCFYLRRKFRSAARRRFGRRRGELPSLLSFSFFFFFFFSMASDLGTRPARWMPTFR